MREEAPPEEKKPAITRGPRKSHRNDGESVFNYLYKEERDRSKSLEERRIGEENQLIKKI